MGSKANKCCCCPPCSVSTECCSCACEALCATIEVPENGTGSGTAVKTCSRELKWNGLGWSGVLQCGLLNIDLLVTQENLEEPDRNGCHLILASGALGYTKGTIGSGSGSGTSQDTRLKYKIPEEADCKKPSISVDSVYGPITIECAKRVVFKNCTCSCKCECLCVGITKQLLTGPNPLVYGIGTACWNEETGAYEGTVTYDDEDKTTEQVTFSIEPAYLHTVGTGSGSGTGTGTGTNEPKDMSCMIGFQDSWQRLSCVAEEMDHRWEFETVVDGVIVEIKQVGISCLQCNAKCRPVLWVPCCFAPLPPELFATIESTSEACSCAGGTISLEYSGISYNGDGSYRASWSGEGSFGCPSNVTVNFYCLLIPTTGLPLLTGGFFLSWSVASALPPDYEDCSEDSFEFIFSGSFAGTEPNWCGKFEPEYPEGGSWRVTISS